MTTRPRVLAVAGYDSFLKVAALVLDGFAAAGAEVRLARLTTRRGQIVPSQLAALGLPTDLATLSLAALTAPDVMDRWDVIVLAVDGTTHRRIALRLDGRAGPRPRLIALFPGLLLRRDDEGFASRAYVDALWLNAEADAARYAAMQAAFGLPADNARVLGPAALLARIPRAPDAAHGPVTFFEQAAIPRWPEERAWLAGALAAFARRTGRSVVVKPRARPGEGALHRATAHIAPLVARARVRAGLEEGALRISYEPAASLIARAGLVATITSTVAVEALHAGAPTAVISDFGAEDDYGLRFFFGSGLLRPLATLDPHDPPRADADWRAATVVDPAPRLPALVAEALAAGRTDTPVRSLEALASSALRAAATERWGVDGAARRDWRGGWAPALARRFRF